MTKFEILRKRYIGDSLHLTVKKSGDLAVPICNFLHSLDIDVDEFDRAYEDVADELIYSENNEYRIDLIGTQEYVHMLIRLKTGTKELLESKLEQHSLISQY